MALADYFTRSALAASQVLAGFDESTFAERLEQTAVGISAGEDACGRAEGRAALDLSVRLLARLYPKIAIAVPGSTGEEAAALAREINPAIELVDAGAAEAGIVIGEAGDRFARSVFAGSDGWDALVDDREPQQVGDSGSPLGAGAAACVAAAGLFRLVFTDEPRLDRVLRLSTYLAGVGATPKGVADGPWTLPADTVLVGGGAIGQGAAWALGRAPVSGLLWVVDGEPLDLGNLQRYVLGRRRDEGAVKAHLIRQTLPPGTGLQPQGFHGTWETFVGEHGRRWPLVLVALDSAEDRRAVQSSLPLRIVNAWTQPGDLGVSMHSDFGGGGACVACLYLPAGAAKSDDVIVAEALGIPARAADVGTLLHTGDGVTRELLEAIAAGLGADLARLLPFEGQPIRTLYSKGICGGAVLPMGAAGRPREDVHVSLAHQSALAGVLLGAAACRLATGDAPELTTVSRFDVMRPVGEREAEPARAGSTGRCLCEDDDFWAAFEAAYAPGVGRGSGRRRSAGVSAPPVEHGGVPERRI